MMALAGNGKNVAFVVLGAALVLVAGIVAWRFTGNAPSALAPAGMPTSLAASADAGPSPTFQRLVFQADSDRLPAGSVDLLTRFADAARAANGATVEISGYYPAGGDAAKGADLAKRRALAVRHALEANGVAPAQMRTAIAQAPAGDAADAAGSVEFVLR